MLSSGSEHTNLCYLTGAQKSFNSCGELHGGFHAIPERKDLSIEW